jgi:hypothetical protein
MNLNLEYVPIEVRDDFCRKLGSPIPLGLRMKMLKYLETGSPEIWVQIFGISQE